MGKIVCTFVTGDEFELRTEEETSKRKLVCEVETSNGSDHAASAQKRASRHFRHGTETQRADVESTQRKTTRNPSGDRSRNGMSPALKLNFRR